MANAVGAALSQVSGKFDKLINITDSNARNEIISKAKQEAIDMAVLHGAIRETCTIADVSEIQMSYMAVPCVRLRVKAVGDLEDYSNSIDGLNSIETVSSVTSSSITYEDVKEEKRTGMIYFNYDLSFFNIFMSILDPRQSRKCPMNSALSVRACMRASVTQFSLN